MLRSPIMQGETGSNYRERDDSNKQTITKLWPPDPGPVDHTTEWRQFWTLSVSWDSQCHEPLLCLQATVIRDRLASNCEKDSVANLHIHDSSSSYFLPANNWIHDLILPAKKFTVFTNAERKIPYTKTIWGVAGCNNNVSYLSHWYWRDHSIKLKSIKINITFLRATNKLCTVLDFISLSLTVSEVNISISSQNFFSSGWKWTGLRNPRLDW